MQIIGEKKLLMLKPEEIIVGDNRPREMIDEYELSRLAESICENGIIEPLTVRKIDQGFELITGERRLRAALTLGMRRVPCILRRADNTAAAVIILNENMQREDLSFFEEATAIRQLIDAAGISQTEAATRLSISQSALCNKLRLLSLSDEQRRKITAADLTERHARALLRLPPEARDGMLNRIIAEGLGIRGTEEAIALALAPKQQEAKAPTRKAAIGDTRIFANSIQKLITTIQNAGFDAHSRRSETESYIEYRVRINKNVAENYTQLKIC